MSVAKTDRSAKSQLGQFITPPDAAKTIVDGLELTADTRVLEPGCGDGSFVIPLIDRFMELVEGTDKQKLDRILSYNITAVEIDPEIYYKFLDNLQEKYGYVPEWSNLMRADFLTTKLPNDYDIIIGNPPFGGTILPAFQDKLDREFGTRGGKKIKKETYSFFLVKSVELLKPGGQIYFICSDSFLTIKTMDGLRRFLMDQGSSTIDRMDYFSEETDYPMVDFHFVKNGICSEITVDDEKITRESMEQTGNFSWSVTLVYLKYFEGPKVGDYMVCTSGMTTGKNELFVREIDKHGWIDEPYHFSYFDDPITLEKETARARNKVLSPEKIRKIKLMEESGFTRRNLKVRKRMSPLSVEIPDPEYKFYNKGQPGIFYSKPKYVIYWRDNGDAVKTYKKNGNWYLHGVGGEKFFGRKGLTWNLVSSRINARILMSGYILDSGAPCGFLREDVDPDVLFLLIGWLATDMATLLLKECINHTMNIQGKDIERLPFPFWMSETRQSQAIEVVRYTITGMMRGVELDMVPVIAELNRLYARES
jgi:predicted RNA methylase